ncbi:D-methionine transport system permease protein [Clostridium tetanomorphum]|uniref:ABC transporter permease n=1 Tax=Clostridium tetanomorphum TaxID=1553 RepID=A0A923ED64_CLOTT|nr:methionine ABC transporter permease [Clostridium tetanomorphum]KAJ53089.1 binding-protein-dependent transport system inner membrane protein [Clostridium tetanomorphum DSM 665]MBC2398373.1 ABC transporter permease [Clostridium tetanomorphum]MBP1865526.1 D-methionine transport system permease protein [Clostridium tetanomorphum]NRS86472.1 D-methionine transport system permease protein [Clostridium tetanomorphum]NRZ95499.1 D-methionine transport system permease protein [Clostridium tetanomorphu
MIKFLNLIIPNVVDLFPDMIKALWETIYMVGISGIISSLIGIPLGIILVVTRENNLLENKVVFNMIGKVVNIFRSIPFVILLTAIIPITRLIVGTTIGTKGAIVPLVFGTAPFVARQIESTLLKVDPGVIEAAKSMGSSPLEIIFRILLIEGLPGIVYALTITTVSLIGFSAVAGTVGGGGLGDFAIRYGYQYFKTDVMVITIIILLIIVNLIQSLGDILLKKLSH